MGHDEDHGPLSTVSKRDDRLEETVDKRIASGRHSRREWASMAWQCTGLCWTVRCATSISALRLISRGNHRESISRVLVQRMRPGSRGAAPLLPHLYTYWRFIVADTLELRGPTAGLLGGLQPAFLILENET